jgi:spermidine synthase
LKKPHNTATGKNNFPWWKRLLSYVSPIRLETASSDYNPHLEVSLSQGRYMLSTANAVYSFDDLYTNFLGTFRKIKMAKLPGDQVLVLGLGLGSIPYMLEKTLGFDFQYTLVEIDEVIVDLAYRYTLKWLDSHLNIIHSCANIFASATYQQYDLICMDVFEDDDVPSLFKEAEFLEKLKNILAPNGLLLYNVLSARKMDRFRTERFYKDQFLKAFPDGAYLEIGSNWILINQKDYLLTK